MRLFPSLMWLRKSFSAKAWKIYPASLQFRSLFPFLMFLPVFNSIPLFCRSGSFRVFVAMIPLNVLGTTDTWALA